MRIGIIIIFSLQLLITRMHLDYVQISNQSTIFQNLLKIQPLLFMQQMKHVELYLERMNMMIVLQTSGW